MQIIDSKIANVFFKTKILLSIIFISSILIKLYYLPFDLPITGDAFGYFGFAIDASVLHHYPEKLIGNDGWPFFMSFFFSLLPSSNFMDFMNIQRLVSVVLSTVTIIPVYLIAKRFLNGPYPLVAALVFAFDPRIIENSILGITEPLYILLGVVSLWFFLTNESKKIYFSFLFASLFTIVRTEGIFLLFALSIIFFLRNKLKKSTIRDYFISIIVFFSILIPIIIIRIENIGYNLVFDKLQIHTSDLIASSTSVSTENNYLVEGVINFVKFLGWDMIPIFIFFVPIGFFVVLKNRNWDNLTILISTFILLVPIFYIYLAGINDSRYFYVLYPILCIYFIIGLKKILKNSKKENLILLLIMIGIVVGSLIFTDSRKMDIEHENEAIAFANVVVKKTQVVNEFWPESRYIIVPTLLNLESFPTLIFQLKYNPEFIYEQTDTLDEYLILGKQKGLTHLVVDEKNYPVYRMSFLKDVFENEEKYPYLIKQYDSAEHGFSYHAKIFKVDYNMYSEFINND